MKVSTRGRYGLKAMIDIAASTKSGQPASLKSIAERQGISENYLEQLAMPLKKAGLVASARGARGGYSLGREAAGISVGDILRALEGSISPAACAESEGASCGTGDCGRCAAKSVWGRLYEGISGVADSINLEELVNESIEIGG